MAALTRYSGQRCSTPTIPSSRAFRHSIETEQGTIAKRVKTSSQSSLPGWLVDELAETEPR